MISVLFATTGRPDRAEASLRGLRKTTAAHDVEIVAAVDADEESRKRVEPLVDVLLYSPVYRGSSRAWNDCLKAAGGDPVVLAADDLVWHEGWLDAALPKLDDFEDGWGLVGFNDGHWGEDLSTHYLMSRRFIVEVLGGVVAWEFYKHSFIDRETNERARKAGRYAWAADSYVTHQHWLFGDRPQDDTDARQLAEHAACERTFYARAAAGFPNDGVEAVIS